MVALRISEGVFLNDYKMLWAQGFSYCRCQNSLVVLKPLESTLFLLCNLYNVEDLLLRFSWYLELWYFVTEVEMWEVHEACGKEF